MLEWAATVSSVSVDVISIKYIVIHSVISRPTLKHPSLCLVVKMFYFLLFFFYVYKNITKAAYALSKFIQYHILYNTQQVFISINHWMFSCCTLQHCSTEWTIFMSVMQINININNIHVQENAHCGNISNNSNFQLQVTGHWHEPHLGKPTLNTGLESRKVEFMVSFKVFNNILQLFVQSKTLFANAVGYTNFWNFVKYIIHITTI